MSRPEAPYAVANARGTAGVGVLLRQWRASRRMSQLDLALAADMSARHLSHVETGKARPSREAVVRLADALEISLRERNALLLAAGYAPQYPETALDRPVMEQMQRAIDFILGQQEPFPAFLVNRHWDVLKHNRAAERVNAYVLGGRPSRHTNMLRQFFDPDDLRAAVANWEEVAGELLRHLQDHVAATPTDADARALFDELLGFPGVPARWRFQDLSRSPSPLLTTVLRRGGAELRFFSTVTTFATPRDVTLAELHIECCFPMDDATARICRQLAADAAQSPASPAAAALAG